MNSQKNFIFVAIIVAVIVLLAGGGYWYLRIYQPAEFGKDFSVLYKKFQTFGDILNARNIRDNRDFSGALEILRQRRDVLAIRRDELLALNLPWLNQEMKDVQAAFSALFEEYLLANAEAESRAVFLANGMELINVFDTVRRSGTPPQNVGEVVSQMDSVMPRARIVAKNLFEDEAQSKTPNLEGETSVEELESLWQDSLRGIDVVLPYARILSPELSLSQFEENVKRINFPDAELVERLDEFLSKLESATYDNNAHDLLAYRFQQGLISGTNLKARFPNADQAVKEILEKYGKG